MQPVCSRLCEKIVVKLMFQGIKSLEELYTKITRQNEVVESSYKRDQALHALELFTREKIIILNDRKEKSKEIFEFICSCETTFNMLSSARVRYSWLSFMCINLNVSFNFYTLSYAVKNIDLIV